MFYLHARLFYTSLNSCWEGSHVLEYIYVIVINVGFFVLLKIYITVYVYVYIYIEYRNMQSQLWILIPSHNSVYRVCAIYGCTFYLSVYAFIVSYCLIDISLKGEVGGWGLAFPSAAYLYWLNIVKTKPATPGTHLKMHFVVEKKASQINQSAITWRRADLPKVRFLGSWCRCSSSQK